MQRIPSDFVAKMSHDLKTPVGNAMMYAELLADDIHTIYSENPELEDKLKPLLHYCGNIRLSSSKLINSIQSWGYSYQIEDGVFDINEEDILLRKLLEDIIKGNRLFIEGKSLNIVTDYQSGREKYRTDSELLHLVVDNLLTLFISMARNGDSIRIEVSDDNNGILFRFFAPDSSFNDKLIEMYCGQFSISDKLIPEQGVLKPGGYGLMFANLALGYINAGHGVEKEKSRTFWFRLPLS